MLGIVGPIGMPELIIILVVALIIFGPKRLPELGRSLGRGIKEFKQSTSELTEHLNDDEKSSDSNAKPEQVEQPQGTVETTTAAEPQSPETKAS